jgi:hypothetical protein
VLVDLCRPPNSPWEFSLRLAARVFGAAITKRKPYRIRKGSNVHVDRATCESIARLKSEPCGASGGNRVAAFTSVLKER